MVKPERAMASFVENPKKTMQKETTIPPPPMPARVDIVIITMSKKSPPNSKPIIGNMFLC